MKLKKVLALALSSAMILSLAGCGSKTEEPAASTETKAAATTETKADAAPAETEAPADTADAATGEQDFSGVTIRFAWWGSQPRHDATIKVIELWEEKTGMTVEYEYYDFNGYFQQLPTLVAADDVWDVFQLGNNWATYYDVIEPLNSYMDSGAIAVDDINESLLKITEDYSGNSMGISLGTNCRSFVYNPALFQEAGVPEPTDTWTWDDFAEACKVIHEKTGAYGIDKLEYFDMIFAACAQMGQGYNFFDMDGSGFAIKDDVTAIAKLMDIMNELEEIGAIADPGVQAEILDEQADKICTGESAMLMIPSNKYVALNEACKGNGVELKLCLMPRLTPDSQSGMLVRSSQMLSMAKSSENKEAAAAFIDFMINSVEANDILNGERGVPINTTVREHVGGKADAVTSEMYAFVDKISAIPDTMYTSNAEPDAMGEIKPLCQTYFEALFAGDYADGTECANAYYEESKRIFDTY